MIGKLIPAGTGMKRYKNIGLDYGVNAEIMESYEREQELAALAEADDASGYDMQIQEDMISQVELTGEDDIEVEMPETPQIVELD